METNFVARLVMLNGVTNPPHVDAIIHKSLTDIHGGDYVKARGLLPFAKRNGVLCSSAAIYQDIHSFGDRVMVRSLRTKDVRAEWVKPNAQDAKKEKEEIPKEEWNKKQLASFEATGKKPYRTRPSERVQWGTSEKGGNNTLNQYPVIYCPYLYYVGVTTDFELLDTLLKQVFFIGKNRGSGSGQIVSIDLQAAGSCDGIVDSNGVPLRNIPVDSKIAVAKDAIVSEASYQPAYWDIDNSAVCYVPPLNRNWTLEQIEKEFS